MKRSMASSGVSTGLASMKPRGWKEPHAGVVQRSLEGAADGESQVGFEHDGVADGLDRNGGAGARCGDGDGLFDEALLYADAHVAQHEFEQVLGLESGGLAEEALDERGADSGGLRDGHGGEGFGDFAEGQDRHCRGSALEQVEGGRAEIAVAPVGRRECRVGGLADGEQSFGEDRAAGVEFALICFGERRSGDVEGKEAGVAEGFRRDDADGVCDGGSLFEPAALAG